MQANYIGMSCLLAFALTVVYASVERRTRLDIGSEGSRAVDEDLLADDPLIAPIGIDPETTTDPRAQFHPHGDKVCASGCAASRHPTEKLSAHQFHRLAERFAAVESLNDLSDDQRVAFESLLYFGPQTKVMSDRFPNSLRTASRTLLLNHLRTTHAKISIRVVDEHDVIRSWIPPTRVPFDRRHVFEMETERLQPHVASGTVKRVGVDRLWIRL